MTLGRTWRGREASEAYLDGTLRSIHEDRRPDKIRIAFRNASSVPLLLCWISHHGKLEHFYRLEPTKKDVLCPVQMEDHVETSSAGHAFCLVHVPGEEEELEQVRMEKKLPDESMIIGGYRPYPLERDDNNEDPAEEESKEASENEELNGEYNENEFGNDILDKTDTESEVGEYDEDDQIDDEEHEMQLVTISTLAPSEEMGADLLCCGFLGGAFLRGSRKRQKKGTFVDVTGDQTTRIAPEDWNVEAKMMEVDSDPYDTTGKRYEHKILGGWPVRVEDNWHDGNPEIEEMLAADLAAASRALPEHAKKYLQKKCLIWINRSIQFGPKVCPITAKACCYHPDRRWLAKNGLNPDKAKCVEINDGPCYADDRDNWGVGGIMIHELSHAYHHRMLKDGYDNKQIQKCYELAMKEGLYESVKVHGPQGPKAKAYAASNCMEYFAELSTAFLGGTDDNEEFNKWQPFNRSQIKQHDPRAYEMLSRVWNV